MKDASARLVLRALDEKRERDGLLWADIAAEVETTDRTLRNSMAWARGEGEHRPSRRTIRDIARWLRRRGVFVASA